MELVKESGKGWGPKACESVYTVPSLKGFLGFSKLKVVSKGPGVFVLLIMFAALLLSKRKKYPHFTIRNKRPTGLNGYLSMFFCEGLKYKFQ